LSAAGPAHRISGDPASRHDVRINTVKKPRDFGTARVGDQGDLVAARHQLSSKCMGWHHMATGATSGENKVSGDGHLPPHFTT
jgi:hypothetical protein